MTNIKKYIVFCLLSFCFRCFAVVGTNVVDSAECYYIQNWLNSTCDRLIDENGVLFSSAFSLQSEIGDKYNAITDVQWKDLLGRWYSRIQDQYYFFNGIDQNLQSIKSLSNSLRCLDSQCTIPFDFEVVSNILSVCEQSFDVVSNGFSSVNSYLVQIRDDSTNIVDFIGYDGSDGEYVLSLSDSLAFILEMMDDTYTVIRRLGSALTTIQGSLYVRVFDDNLYSRLGGILSAISNVNSFVDHSFTNRFYRSSLLGWDRFQSYLQAQRADQTVSWYPFSPYDSQSHLQNATIYDALAAGFENTLISLGSLNNYFYWIKNHMPSNSFDDAKVLASIGVLSNTLNRIDNYVVQDFSNEFYRLSRYILTNENYKYESSLVSNYYHSVTGSLFAIRDLFNTNNFHLASIETAVTNIDFSVGRFRDYLLGSQNSISDYDGSEDSSYYDFLTNKYIVGTSDDGVSSNWFERIETLLAALVFSTDSNTNIVSSGSFDGISENDVRRTLESVSFHSEFGDMVGSVGSVQRSFTDILNSLYNSVKYVTKPQSISIGFSDNGATTSDFNGLLQGDFEISVSVGEFGSFTEVVRAVTTMIIVLITLIMIYKTCFFLIRNAYRLYSFGRTLVTSIFFR